MSKKEWGNVCWFLFHGMATKVKEEHFDSIKNDIWQYINDICSNLPCPECRKHATELMSKTNKNIILNSKRNLERFLFDFHNIVNKRNNSRIMTIEEYDALYNKINLIVVINKFILIFFSNSNNSKLMIDAMHRQFIYSNFMKWITINIYKFNL